ncbi:nucleoside diphosphate kinase regulator (plasmid) [Sphingomonas paeninsulae]|jgi:regulator of nucleoside diphosphate kinase|uniref:Nucleoside diphosphate kinase regulator n=1 Tax=Sphingomonas paeninsulae TaxID=2319844 RepID=A0A494TH18_SPHPE|nr:nucleoside diphosphate kinase regulator [Sphingomonas paeninsulae]AYJ84728.1 nucleoside diphosphate kinase regulator [Sphingomonas paeninsulae]
MEQHTSLADLRPDIHLSAAECDALWDLALRSETRHPQSSAMLLDELGRAKLCGPENLPDETVVMNSLVDFIDEGTGTRRVVQLVYPQDADIGAGRISILTPIGAGLIGMTAGNSIRWPDRDGQDRMLRIVTVMSPIEA